ncbi:MAG: DNA/RNA helicase [Microbacteriaceae bacterium]|nr:DNA/RNA helicase [Microbacteriaceae bacterium]
MSLSRKRQRELKKLRAHAEALISEQRDLLGSAGLLAGEAGRQAKHLGNEVVVPRVNEALEGVRPTLDRGVSAARRFGDQARLLAAPVLATALASTVRGLDRMENRDAARQIEAFGVRQGLLQPAKKKNGVLRVLAIGAGVAAAAAVGYTLWQAFRTDDELWVAPEDRP